MAGNTSIFSPPADRGVAARHAIIVTAKVTRLMGDKQPDD
jgi:hypothetical protein